MKTALIQYFKYTSPPLLIPATSSWISKTTFVTATRSSEKKLDKETCEKLKEVAETVTEGIKEVRKTGEFVKETATADAGKVVSTMVKKAVEMATEETDEKEENGKWEKVKHVVEKFKGK